MVRKNRRVLLLLLSVVILPTAGFSQKKFDIYGFMDVEFTKMSLKNNNFFQTMDWLTPQPRLLLGHVNLYFDFIPNDFTRALVEIALNSNAYDNIAYPGRSISITSQTEQDLYNAVYGGALMQGADAATAQATAKATLAGMQKGFAAAGTNYDNGRKYGGIKIERAWFDLKANDQVNFRFGRFLTPAGIWNVDHGSPLILTIGQPNQNNMVPIFPNAQNGVMFHGRTFLGDHDLDYKLYLSSGRDNENLNNLKTAELADFGVGGHLGINFDLFDGVNIGASGYTDKVKKSRLMQEYTFNNVPDVMAQNLTLDDFTYNWYTDMVSREICAGVDAKAKFYNIWLQAEYNHQRNENQLMNNAVTPIHGFYILAAYEATVNKNFGPTPYVFFESLKWKDAQLNPVRDLYMYPFNGWDQLNMGLNLRIFSNIRLKLEYGMAFMEVINKPYNMNVDPNSSSFNGMTDEQKYNSILENEYGKKELNISSFRTQVAIAF